MSAESGFWFDIVGVCRSSKLFERESSGALSSERIDYVRFDVGLFSMDVYRDNLTDEVGVLWRYVNGGAVVPDPIEAIFYFCSDSNLPSVREDGEEDYFEGLRETFIVYLNNRWVFNCSDWVGDAGFKLARSAANEWALQQKRPMRFWEFEGRISLERKRLMNADPS